MPVVRTVRGGEHHRRGLPHERIRRPRRLPGAAGGGDRAADQGTAPLKGWHEPAARPCRRRVRRLYHHRNRLANEPELLGKHVLGTARGGRRVGGGDPCRISWPSRPAIRGWGLVPLESPPAKTPSVNRGLLRAGSAVASAALLTAVVSFGKEVSVARLFGAGITYDAYLVAFAAVTLLPTVIAFVLQSTFIPSFLESRQRSPAEAWAFAGTVVTLLSVGLLLGMVLLVVLENAWFSLVIPGFGAPARREVSRVVVLLLPLVWLVGLNELLKSLLNALRSFALPAASQVLPSLFALVAILVWGRSYGIVALAIGWVFGMIVQTGVLVWRCRLLHVRLPLGFRSPSGDLSNLVGLSGPYLAVALMPWALLLIDQH
ncbi:MAG: hypothetical protein E6I60_15755, partial [Chloroflexi bacterium]